MRLVPTEPLTVEAFAPYGDVLSAPASRGRAYFERGLGNARPSARASLSMSLVAPLAALPLAATRMERHEFSSQTFLPLSVARWLVIVAPHAPEGGPDTRSVKVFLAGPGQGVTYRMNVWHHPLTVLDAPAEFAVFMWRDGGAGDEEFVTLKEPFTVAPG
jgi:ureidoglycolate lyase